MAPEGRPDPPPLPRQRRGTTPQMYGRYPDHDVLAQAEHWDARTRAVVLDRVENVPRIRFFTPVEAAALGAFCDVVTAQDAEPRIPVLNMVDVKLHAGRLDGYRYADMPDDRDTWRLVARGLDEEARRRGADSYAAADWSLRHAIVEALAAGDLRHGAWDELNVTRAFAVVMRAILAAFYSHPWAWNEIGFGGPAYPRGYASFGSPHLAHGEAEAWEGREAVHVDPVRDVRERGLE
jgi:Gluconate 2-dehydrogenase subunit 3